MKMKTISADFNAKTEMGAVRLNSRGSQDDMRDQGVKVGDIAYVTDGEIRCEAHIAIDERYGVVGILRKYTLVYLDEDQTKKDDT